MLNRGDFELGLSRQPVDAEETENLFRFVKSLLLAGLVFFVLFRYPIAYIGLVVVLLVISWVFERQRRQFVRQQLKEAASVTTPITSKKGETMPDPNEFSPNGMSDEEIDRILTAAVEEAKAEVRLPVIKPPLTRGAIQESLDADLIDHWLASWKARFLAKANARFAHANIQTIEKFTHLVMAKARLFEETYKMAFKAEDLKAEQEEKRLRHKIRMAKGKVALAKAERELEQVTQPPTLKSVEIVDEEKEIYQEVERIIGRKLNQEIFKQRLKFKAIQQLLKEMKQQQAVIDADPTLTPEEKQQEKERIKRRFVYTIKKIEEEEEG
jgi:hypothetical protein